MFDKFKKEVGFIKNHSSKKELPLGKDSDDSFSSFEYQPYRHEEFSPYKHSHLQKQRKEEKDQKNKMQPQFSNLILRNNLEHKQDKKKNEKKSKELKHAIKDESEEQTPKLQSASSSQEEELSLSNINQFQKGKSSKVAPTESKAHKTIAQYQKYLQQSESSSSEEAIIYKKTVKSKQPQPKQSKLKKQEPEEELITEWDKRQFKDKRIKTAILNQQRLNQPIKNGICQTKGGICFELDKRQFKSRPKQQKRPSETHRRRRDVNSREEILKRKQQALIFDRQSRIKIFGYV